MLKATLWLVLACSALSSAPAFAADMTARQVTQLLFAARTNSTPDLSNKDLSGS